jgi:hypothetical protein
VPFTVTDEAGLKNGEAAHPSDDEFVTPLSSASLKEKYIRGIWPAADLLPLSLLSSGDGPLMVAVPIFNNSLPVSINVKPFDILSCTMFPTILKAKV